mmetsp:Transcript_22769/g.37715  ORF Transcript_22769/g.37715 Transcript_22769/m.37715 type:complete len:130 (+) Transcript_22769:423-812(+)
MLQVLEYFVFVPHDLIQRIHNQIFMYAAELAIYHLRHTLSGIAHWAQCRWRPLELFHIKQRVITVLCPTHPFASICLMNFPEKDREFLPTLICLCRNVPASESSKKSFLSDAHPALALRVAETILKSLK